MSKTLPAGFDDTRDFPDVGALSEADPANTELADIATGTATQLAAIVGAGAELGLALGFCDE